MLLEVSNLSVEYRAYTGVHRIVNDLSVNVAAGEVVGIVGESGSGKSTAVLAMLGLTWPGATITGGSVKLEGRELLGLTTREWQSVRGAEIGLITQNPRGSLNPVMRIGDQITAVYRAHRKADKDAARDRALELLRSVGINDPERRLSAFPHELSGGMAQRVLIAMALACTPRVLLADEPTSGLDVTVQVQVLDDLRHAANDVGSSMILVSQDLGIIANYCDRVFVLNAGEAVEHAPITEFFARPSHPATIALLAAQRGRDDDFRLTGPPPDPRRLPQGCYLNPRCPFATEEAGCFAERPDLLEVRTGHSARCFRHEEVLVAVRGADAADTRVADTEARPT